MASRAEEAVMAEVHLADDFYLSKRERRCKKDSGTNTDFFILSYFYINFTKLLVGICCVLCLHTVNDNSSKSAKSDLRKFFFVKKIRIFLILFFN